MEIKILSSNHILPAAPGDNLYQVLAGAGLLDAACGGQGRCGKCRVKYGSTPPPPQPPEEARLSPEELAAGWRLACLQQVEADTALELPQQDKGVIVGAFWGGTDNIIPDQAQGYGLAIDIGTTTLAAALVDLSSGRQLAVATCLNSQKSFGQDVVSRINYAQTKKEGTSTQQKAVIADINSLLTELCAGQGIAAGQISMACAAGNPTMIHLLAGVNPTPLGLAPYTLVCKGPLHLPAQSLGLPLAKEAEIYCLPAVAAYLGGDIIGGMLAVSLNKPGAARLFIDIGTNGEIVLAQDDKLYACSTAAGPALEGMNIQCGMRAAARAIDMVSINGDTVHYSTIGSLPPLGLAGSGLLSAVSALLSAGLMDARGRIQQKGPIRQINGQRSLVIDEEASIILTQGDIRQVQLAKGAIRSGVDTLLSAIGCPPESIDEVLVAGGFGAHLPQDSLIKTGLLPHQFAGKIQYLGNAALAGARLCLLKAEIRALGENLANQISYIELAQLQDYQKRFIKAMSFD